MPLRDEYRLLRSSLPSCYRLNPDEILLCMDDPPDERTLLEIKRIADRSGWTERTRIVAVARNPEYGFHQAWVRREGFRQAKHDRILTVDADLILNGNVLKAVSLVGSKHIGFVSCVTMHSVGGILGLWRAAGHRIASHLRPTALTGLYALWRPYWEDSESGGIKLLKNPKLERGSLVLMGEDTYLHNCMQIKHRCIHLPDIGAYCMRPDCNDSRHIQFELGRYYAELGYSFISVLIRTFAFARPVLPSGYLHQKKAGGPIPTLDPATYPY